MAKRNKLSSTQVAEIMVLYKTTKLTQRQIAERFNVSQPTISDITRGKSRLGKEPRPLKPCGTDAAYARHIKAGEVADIACLKAHSEAEKRYSIERKKRNGQQL